MLYVSELKFLGISATGHCGLFWPLRHSVILVSGISYPTATNFYFPRNRFTIDYSIEAAQSSLKLHPVSSSLLSQSHFAVLSLKPCLAILALPHSLNKKNWMIDFQLWSTLSLSFTHAKYSPVTSSKLGSRAERMKILKSFFNNETPSTRIDCRLSSSLGGFEEQIRNCFHQKNGEKDCNLSNMSSQLRVDSSRVKSVHRHSRVFQSPRQLSSEKNIRQFALWIAMHFTVGFLAV